VDGLVAGLVVRDARTGSLLRLANDGDMSLDNICENATKQFLLYVQRFLMGNDVCEWEACLRRQAAQALLYKLAAKRLICGCPCAALPFLVYVHFAFLGYLESLGTLRDEDVG